MDAASTLKVRLGWRMRRVEMADAEASFDVAKDPQRPFVILVGDKTVRVVGTMFNIRHYDGLFTLTVSRGVVEVRRMDAAPGPVSRLQAGDEVRGRDGSPDLIRAKVDPSTAFAWADNRLVVSDQPLPEVVAFLNRRYTIPIRLTPVAAKRRFSGSLELGDEDLVVRRLGAFLALPVHRNAHDFTLG
jgi:transmembrane sensor